MASRDQALDEFAGSKSVSQSQKDNSPELSLADYISNDSPISFPFMPLPISPLSAGNFYGYEQNFPSGAVHDLNMVIDVDEHDKHQMNIPFDQGVISRNDIPSPNHQFFNLPSGGADTMSSGHQTPNDTYPGRINRDSISTNSFGVGNFYSSVLDAETQKNRRQLTEISTSSTNSSTNFCDSAPIVAQSIVPRVCDTQVKVNSSQPNNLDKLDGRFLSLGYQGNVATNVNSGNYDGKASHMSEISFSPQDHFGNDSFYNVRDNLAGFQNDIGDLVTPSDCASNLTFTGDDYCGLRAMTSAHDTSSVSNLHGGQVNMHQYIPTPSHRTSESGNETDSKKSSSDPPNCSITDPHMLSNTSRSKQGLNEYMKRKMPKVPFSSSVLKSNHQNAVGPSHNSYLSTNLMLPAPGIILEESGSQGNSGQFYTPYTGQGQGADITLKDELPCVSTAISRRSIKRRLDLPPRDSMQDQRRKMMPQTSAQQFSPDLLQNALSKFATSHSMPVVTTFTNSSIIPSDLHKDSVASDRTKNTSLPPAAGTVGASNTEGVSQQLMTSASAFVPPLHIPATRSASEENSLVVHSSTVRTPAALAKTTSIPVVVDESPALASPPMGARLTALARTAGHRSGSARISSPSTSTKRVVTTALSSSARNSASTAAPRKTNSPHTSSTMTRAALSDWRKSLPALAALAKSSPAFRVSQVPNSMAHIKWQVVDTPPIIGLKCMLCKRDLSFTPEGPVSRPPIPPAVAVLPCGHAFHDHCLQLIIPEDQAKDPPCIPCAMGEK